MNCKYCGRPVSKADTYCKHCYKSLTDTPKQVSTAAAKSENKPTAASDIESHGKLAIFSIIAIVLVGIVTMIIMFGSGPVDGEAENAKNLPCFVVASVGLTICFGGIYLKRFFSAVIGLVWGFFIGLMIFLLINGSLSGLFDEDIYLKAIIIGVIFSVISAALYKLCAVVNSFLSVVTLVLLLTLISSEEFNIAVIIAIIFGTAAAVIAYKYYDYAFMLLTAFTGAFIASIGFFGLLYDGDLEDVIEALLTDSDTVPYIVIATLVLTVLGFLIQLRRFQYVNKKAKALGGDSSQAGSTEVPGKEQAQPEIQVPESNTPVAEVVSAAEAAPADEAMPSADIPAFCGNCGKPVKPEDAFCRYCGHKKGEF